MYAQKLSRAVSRPLLADAHPPFLPFLYHTKTICRSYATEGPSYTVPSNEYVQAEMEAIKERWSSPGARQSRQRAAAKPRSREPRGEKILFEGSTGSTNPEEQFEDTTMTPRELRIFEELFRKGVGPKSAACQLTGCCNFSCALSRGRSV